MIRDFTLRMYRNLMETVTTSVYTPTTVCDYLTSPLARAVILRHDVERAPERALDMAQVEEEMGVQGSNYFSFRWATNACETYHLNRCVL